jgi:CBS domain-containing protein
MLGPVSDFMTKNPLTVREDELASAALDVLRRHKIDELPVVNQKGKTVGMLDVQDLIKEGFLA